MYRVVNLPGPAEISGRNGTARPDLSRMRFTTLLMWSKVRSTITPIDTYKTSPTFGLIKNNKSDLLRNVKVVKKLCYQSLSDTSIM